MAVAKRAQATKEGERARGSRAAVEPTPVVLAQSTPDMWPGQPANYRGLAFGASRDEARRIIQPFKCMDEWSPGISYRAIAERSGKPEWEVECLSSNSISGVAFEDIFRFDHEKLVEVDFVFPPSQFGRLREAFEDKFGRPNRAETAEVRTLAGFKDDNETLYWLGKGVLVSLARYHRTVTEGIAHFTSVERLRKMNAEDSARRARAKSDF